jgi:hypothetical protein
MMQGEVGLFEIARVLVQWVVLPVAGFVWLLHKNQQQHQTDIAVLKAVHEANKEAHDREFKEMRESFKAVFAKLDNIEQALRK